MRAVHTYDGDVREGAAGDAVTLVLDDEIDASRGDVIVAADDRLEITDQFAAHLVWLGDEPMLPGASPIC